MSTFPDYNQLAGQLLEKQVESPPAEIQGLVSGVLVLPDGASVDWLDLILSAQGEQPDDLGSDLSQALLDMFRETQQQLSGENFNYDLYLPAPDQGIESRVRAIAAWCRGFLLGISATGLSVENTGDVVREILSDVVELSSVETGDEDDAEAEHALMEIEEYLRAAVQLLKEELNPVSDS